MCVCVCVCVRARAYVCVCVRVCLNASVDVYIAPVCLPGAGVPMNSSLFLIYSQEEDCCLGQCDEAQPALH